ncbi:MAG: hypothetical protein JWR29_1036 [Tardiphaga sp.]|nr:hypothetical protein [Tardiphaga sp.]
MSYSAMSHSAFRLGLISLALLAAAPAAAWDVNIPDNVANAMAQGSDYSQRLAEYQRARAAFDEDAEAYWSAVSEKRRARIAKRRDRVAISVNDYVLQQPPLYEGPPRPRDPNPAEPDGVTRPRKPLPVAADFLRAAAEEFQFAPQRASESEFKRAYARVALANGLTREQAVRVYSFETGGNGNHDLQSGLNPSKPGSRAISTAVGYNQLLTANTITLVAEQGSAILKDLNDKAARSGGAQRATIERKIAVVKRMLGVVRSVPQSWSAYEKLGLTPQGWGIHALVYDIDIGPLLQTHKLMTSVQFARAKGYSRPLSAAELEMMNLTGDGNGFDMVSMPQSIRDQVPTANFFQRSGYERNPVAIRHNTVAKLLAITDSRMDANSALPGARELAAAF